MNSTLIRGGTLVTMNGARDVLRADLRLENGEIVEIGMDLNTAGSDLIDATDCFVIPGLIQVHTHLVQTLFRGYADDLELLDWLKEKIWPMENAHDKDSIRASARIGLLEMQLSGTTSILDMGTVRLHEEIFAEAETSKMRYWGGNCLMDMKSTSGPLYREREDTLKYTRALIAKWHRKTPLIEYAISPRFAISCTDRILKECAALAKEFDLVIHTHASENKSEVALVRKRSGLPNVQFLKKMGCLHEKSVIAHAIHLNTSEVNDIVKARAGVAHCPSSNLKLASGIAKIQTYRKKGMKIGLGSDGAPCNNSMDAFIEMRLAALLQKPLFGPTALPAREAFELATLGGAACLGRTKQIGSLEAGKRADVVIVKRDHPSVATVEDPYSALVYSCTGRDVRDVWIDGNLVVRDGAHQIFDVHQVNLEGRRQIEKLLARVQRSV